MLAAPDYDTYHCMEKFAHSPDAVTRMGLDALLYRTNLRLMFEVGSSYRDLSIATAENIFATRIGSVRSLHAEKPAESARASDIVHSMTDEERAALYVRACKNAGIDIDVNALMPKTKDK